MVGKYKVITLCGSTRFKDAFLEMQKRLTLEGNIVISVGLFGHSGDYEVWTEGTKEMLDDMNTSEIQAVADQSLDAKFLEDLRRTKSEVRIDIPGRINTDPIITRKLAEVLQKLNQSGKTVIIRAEHKQELPTELRSMAIENEFVTNPVTMIDKEVSWFGQPASGACFITEGKPLQVWCRPVVRFVGKHCAKCKRQMVGV